MFQFLASIVGVLVSSPKAKQALRSLAVKGTVATLEVKEQIGNTIRSMKDDSTAEVADTDQALHSGNMNTQADSSNYVKYNFNLEDKQQFENTLQPDAELTSKQEALPDLKHTFAVLNDETIEKYLPKP